MSLDAKRTYTVPDQTALVARAIFPGGNSVMRLYDDLHMVVADRVLPICSRLGDSQRRRRFASHSRRCCSSWKD